METNNTESTEKKNSWLHFFNHNWFSIAMVLFSLVLCWTATSYSGETASYFATKIANKSLVLFFIVIYTLFWRSSDYVVERKISQDSIAISIFLGCTFVALGIA